MRDNPARGAPKPKPARARAGTRSLLGRVEDWVWVTACIIALMGRR